MRARSRASTRAIATCSAFRRDLLTAAAYGVDEFLCVYGDRPSAGARVEQLSVRDMIREVRTFDDGPGVPGRRHERAAPAAGWKQEADFCFVQIGFDVDALARWRDDRGRSTARCTRV